MAKFGYGRSNVALNTANDLMTIIGAASRRARLLEVSVTGMGTTSAAGEIGVHRSTGGTTGSGALTAVKASTDHPAAGMTVNTAWVSQPTLTAADAYIRLGCNSNGANYRWVARPGQELEIRGTEQISIRPAVGSHNVSLHIIMEEDW